MNTLQAAGRDWRKIALICMAAALMAACSSPANSSSPNSSASASGSSCGTIPQKLPVDHTGVLATLPAATVAGYNQYPFPIKKSAYSNYKAPHPKPWKIAHVGNFQGNAWHATQQAAFISVAKQAEKAGLVSAYTTVIANNNVATQMQQIRSLIQQHYNMIVLEPASATGLDGVINEAKAAGMVVVTQDSPVSDTNAVNVLTNPVLYGAVQAQALVKAMGTSGNVLEVQGIPGNPDNTLFNLGASVVFKNCPNIKIVGMLTGNWLPATAKSQVLSYLSTHPSTIDGVWESSTMATAIIQAFQQAGRKVPPVTDGDPDKSSLAYWRDHIGHGYKGAGGALPPGSDMNAAVRVGLKILEGQGIKVNVVSASAPEITAANLRQWVKPGWTETTPGVSDVTIGKLLNDSTLAPLFAHPAPAIP